MNIRAEDKPDVGSRFEVELVKAFAGVKEGDYDAIPIVAMTANAFTEDVQENFAAGMNAHVSKPIDIAVLERTLKGIFGR